jgi:hypothetical protein
MKDLRADSIMLGTKNLVNFAELSRKLVPRQLFKLKCFKTCQIWELFFDQCIVQPICLLKIQKEASPNFEKFGLSKKTAIVSNFCLIGKIPHNFLVSKIIESACKTFMPIQTLGLHRVRCSTYALQFI